METITLIWDKLNPYVYQVLEHKHIVTSFTSNKVNQYPSLLKATIAYLVLQPYNINNSKKGISCVANAAKVLRACFFLTPPQPLLKHGLHLVKKSKLSIQHTLGRKVLFHFIPQTLKLARSRSKQLFKSPAL